MQPNELTASTPQHQIETSQPSYIRDIRPRGIKWVKAAGLLAEGKSIQEVAKAVEVLPNAVRRWKMMPKFQYILRHYIKRIEDESTKNGIAGKVSRLRKLDKHSRSIEKIAEERAADIEMSAVAGGTTGWITRDVKSLGSGPGAQRVDVYEFDAALSKEYRETLKQAAMEMGGAFEQATAAPTNSLIQNNFLMMLPDQAPPQQVQVIELPPANQVEDVQEGFWE